MSRLPFELFLVLRYLRPKRTFVSVITLLSVIGVMLGVAVLIVVISVMSGFDKEWRERILGFNAHLKVTASQRAPLEDWELVMSAIRSNKLVKGVSPYILAQVLVKSLPTNGSQLGDAPYLRGIDPELERTVSILPKSIVEGEYNVDDKGILVGIDFARRMRLEVGDRLLVYSPGNLKEMEQSKGETAIVPEEFTVRGIFDVGFADYNAFFIASSLFNAQDLYDLGDSVHGLTVMLHDPMHAPLAKAQLLADLGGRAYISTWIEDNSEIFGALVTEKNVMFFLLFFIMVVAAFGITSVLITFVVQKTREIGILKAIGATNLQVTWIFLSQSVMVGVWGVLSGLALGFLALKYRNEFLAFLNKVTGRDLLPSGIYKISDLPMVVVPLEIAMICGGSLLICVLAGVLPAWNAGRLQPVEALRNE